MSDPFVVFMAGLLTGMLSIITFVLATGGKPRSVFQDEAVKSGHAEYYLDENNNKQWRWK